MTDPTADAAKRLPCPTFWVVERFENERSAGYWSGGNSRAFLHDIEKAIHFCRREDAMWTIMGWHWGDVKITEHSYIENTRPQPAPPAGEPDFEIYANHLAYEGPRLPNSGGKADTDWIFQRALEEFERMYRLGLTAQPKVEDAEVAAMLEALDSGDSDQTPTPKECRDLLERLAGELVEVKRDRDSWHRFYQGYRKDFEALYRRLGVPDTNDEQAGINLCDRIEALLAAESKLAEREADLRTKETQLAQADAAIDAKFPADGGKPKRGSINARHVAEAIKRHQSRQQAAKDNRQ